MRLGRRASRQRPNLLGAAARTAVIAGTASAVTGAVRRRHHSHHSHNGTPPAAGITDDQLSRLERLADLKNAGVLSEEEFEVEKAQLLGRPPS
jgi:putative oligomerization/nucleic acid binding protein